jgi:SAM-dependent methyltransferase
MSCRVCGGGPLDPLTLPEQHFGTGAAYAYQACRACGGWQIESIPADLAACYPKGYYSLQAGWLDPMRNPLRRWLKGRRDRHWLEGRGWLGRLLGLRTPYPELASLGRLAPRRDQRVLDVGCGNGFLLWSLWNLGFRRLQGLDPNLEADLQLEPGLWLRRAGLEAQGGAWDLILFMHSLEHVPDPLAALQEAARLLAPGGRCLVRVPTPDSEAARRYGPRWIQADPPRHLHLFSRRGLASLAGQAGLRVAGGWDDSTGFQFWGSELGLAGRALAGAEPGRLFTRAQRRAWEAEARALNRASRGDSIAVVLERA